MKGYEPNLLEKLLDEDPRSNATSGVSRTVSLEQYKDSVVRDLEGLLNSRAAFSEARLEAFPQCRRSMMTYGLEDFSGKSLANAHDRAGICRSLEQAIARHEPRLTSDRVSLHSTARNASSLHFAIHALLDLQPAREPISFDAMLQTSTQHYSISRARRIASVA